MRRHSRYAGTTAFLPKATKLKKCIGRSSDFPLSAPSPLSPSKSGCFGRKTKAFASLAGLQQRGLFLIFTGFPIKVAHWTNDRLPLRNKGRKFKFKFKFKFEFPGWILDCLLNIARVSVRTFSLFLELCLFGLNLH